MKEKYIEKNIEKNQAMKDVVTERIMELLNKSDKLNNSIGISKTVKALTAIGATTSGLGYLSNPQSDLLAPAVVMGGVTLASAVAQRILQKKQMHTDVEREQLEKLRENEYFRYMQSKNTVNYDNFSAVQLDEIEDVEIEF